MRVNMSLINMGTADESVVAVSQLHGEVISDTVCRFRIGFPRLETDTKMVSDNILLALIAPGDCCVLVLTE